MDACAQNGGQLAVLIAAGFLDNILLEAGSRPRRLLAAEGS